MHNFQLPEAAAPATAPSQPQAATVAATQVSAPIVLRDDERQRCEVWTRVMGYHRPLASFNIGKQGEFHERRQFVETPGA